MYMSVTYMYMSLDALQEVMYMYMYMYMSVTYMYMSLDPLQEAKSL